MFSKFATVAQTTKDPRLARTVRDCTILRKTVKCKVIICIKSSDKIEKQNEKSKLCYVSRE